MLVITLHLLKYPIASVEFDWDSKVGIDNPFPVLNSFEIEKIKEILPLGYIDEIRIIALNDKETQDLYNHILSIPDMTEAEKEVQIIDFDKSMI